MVLVFLIGVYQGDHGSFHCWFWLLGLLALTDAKIYVGSYILGLLDLTGCFANIKVNVFAGMHFCTQGSLATRQTSLSWQSADTVHCVFISNTKYIYNFVLHLLTPGNVRLYQWYLPFPHSIHPLENLAYPLVGF